MKSLIPILAVVLVAALLAPADLPARVRYRCDSEDRLFRGNDVSVDIDDGVVIFTNDDEDETVEITEEGDLFVNGASVKLDRREKTLVAEYYETLHGIQEEVKEIAVQGAKIGVKGAAIGIKAALGALFALGGDIDMDDVECAIDEQSDEIDRAAKKLEKRAKRLEKRAESLERLHETLRRDVKELDELGWF